jgi:diamine N-acetyltransferase
MADPDYALTGERVALGPLRTDLAETYRRWLHDLDVRAGLMNPGLFGREAEEDWVRETNAKCAAREPEIAAFTIYDLQDDEAVGTSSLFEIQWRLRRATFGILLGERRGKGLGTEATRLVLDWGFNILGLASVMLEVLPYNAAAIAAYERAGFQRIGLRRDAVLDRGRPGDVLLMDAVALEFTSPVLARRSEAR